MIVLRFGNRPGTVPFPSAADVTEASAFAARHGEYRIAQQLLGLACALDTYERAATDLRWLERAVERGERPAVDPAATTVVDGSARYKAKLDEHLAADTTQVIDLGGAP